MKLLADLIKIQEGGNDLSRLPKDVLSAIKKNIRKGAEDLDQKWGNALELVHKAYYVEGIERPEPSMTSAWTQYEEMLAYAVKQLADNRGMDDDWRMSSAMFHEALEARNQFTVEITNKAKTTTYITEAKEINEILNTIELPEYQLSKTQDGNTTKISYSKWGIKQPTSVTIRKI